MSDRNEIIKSRVMSVISQANCYPFLFIGSGLSIRYMGTRNWVGLLQWACETVLEDEFAYARFFSEAKGGLPLVASLLEGEANRALLTKVKFESFRELHADELKLGASPLKIYIADDLQVAKPRDCGEVELLRHRCGDKISGVITTNYDFLAESLFPQCDVFIGEEELLFREISYSAEIYKIHGSSSKPDSMILTSEDYRRFEERQAYLAAKILTIFMEYPVIFLGYSLSDSNIQFILSAIAKCVGGERLSALSERFVFVEHGDAPDPVSKTSFVFGEELVSMTRIVTRDFTPIFEAMAESRTMYNPRVVRTLRRSVYAIASHLDPGSEVRISGFSQLDRLGDDEKIVVGFAPLRDGYGRMPSVEELYKDALFDDLGLDPNLVVADYLPRLLKSNPGGLPMFKYLKDVECGELDQRLRDQLDNHKTLDSYLNDGIRKTAKGWRRALSVCSVRGLIDEFGFEKAYERVAALKECEINPNELQDYLVAFIGKNGGVECIKGKSELKRAIRIWDYLKYGPK